MDSSRFDTLARGMAAPTSRRTALRGLAGGGLLSALGLKTAAAATPAFAAAPAAAVSTCTWQFIANVRLGPDTGVMLMAGATQAGQIQGTLTLPLGADGAIDQGQLKLANGTTIPVVGQATGRAISLRLTLAQGKTLVAVGTAEQALTACSGTADGPLEGPLPGDLGDWHMTAMGASGGTGNTTGGVTVTTQPGAPNPAPSTAPAPSQAPSPSPSPSDNPGGGGGTAACASGVVCSGVCCQPAPGLTPDSMVCNAGSCECTYSCAAAGCGGGSGTIVNTCGSDPQPHCHSECNVPTDNGCGDMTCPDGQTLDVDSCTCVQGAAGGTDNCGGADLLHDANNCGTCGIVCGSGFCQNGVCANSDPCVQEGRTNCNSQCMDTQNDPENCGGCGTHCPSGQCIEGNCTDVVK